jgi:Protein of unknown function (DUF3318)
VLAVPYIQELPMNSPMNCTLEILEIKRLSALLPETVRSQISILPSPEADVDLITTVREHPLNYHIQINFNGWQSFSCDRRNLLFWHEVARIQSQSVRTSSQELVVLSIGTIALLGELIAQNLLGVVTTLAVTGLVSYHLYQQHRGENALRATSAADRDAIELATQFGYSFPDAHESLCSALQHLAKWKSQKKYRKRYQIRLRVLEMLRDRETSGLGSTAPSSHSPLPYQVSPLCS